MFGRVADELGADPSILQAVDDLNDRQPGLLEAVPRLSADEAKALARDMNEARDSLAALRDEDPWES